MKDCDKCKNRYSQTRFDFLGLLISGQFFLKWLRIVVSIWIRLRKRYYRNQLTRSEFLHQNVLVVDCCNILEQDIDTGDWVPVAIRLKYILSPYMQNQVNDELKRMMKLDIIEPSRENWSTLNIFWMKMRKTYVKKETQHFDLPFPKNIKENISVIGMSGFYRRFNKNFSEITVPITDFLCLTKKVYFVL